MGLNKSIPPFDQNEELLPFFLETSFLSTLPTPQEARTILVSVYRDD